MPTLVQMPVAAVRAAHGTTAPLAWPSTRYGWTVVAVLMAAYTCAFVDRQILALLVEPIKRDLNISDTQFSLLNGLAFTLFYTVMGLPLAWLADRGSRRGLIMVSLNVWSLMTAACGLASGYWGLFAARVGVGVGEAGLSPAAYSMIADCFPPEKRSRAMGVYAMGGIAGAGVAFMIGGAVIHWAGTADPIILPWVGELRTWQVAFLVVAVPGPLIAMGLSFLREPARRLARSAGDGGARLSDFLRRRWRVFSLLTLGYGLTGMVVASYKAWAPAMLMRRYGWDAPTVGLAFGLMLVLGCTSGVFIGGWIADRFAKSGRPDAVLRASLIAATAIFPFAVGAPLMRDSSAVAVMLACATFAFGMMQGLPAPALQAMAPNRLRARVLALYFMLGNPIAFIIGPTAVALISDWILHDPQQIGLALAVISVIALPFAGVCLIASLKPYCQAVAEEGAT